MTENLPGSAAGRVRRATVVLGALTWLVGGIVGLATEHPLVGLVVFLSPLGLAYVWIVAAVTYEVGRWVWRGPRPGSIAEGIGGRCDD